MEKIVFKNVCLGYTKDINIVKDASFSIKKGDFVSIIGVNGSGKSTLLFALFSMVNQNSGEIFYDGLNLKSFSKKDISKKIAFVPQLSTFPEDVTLWEFVQLGRHPYNSLFFSNKKDDEEKIRSALDRVGLSNLENKYIDELSGGQRQRIVIARALINDPKIIIADEAISALDVSIQAQVVNMMKELCDKRDVTFLFIAHDISMVHYICNKVIIMHNGKIVEKGSTNKIFKNPIHPYTQSLLKAVPELWKMDVDLSLFGDNSNYSESYSISNKPHFMKVENDHEVLATKEQFDKWV